jgi:hypothetical protein
MAQMNEAADGWHRRDLEDSENGQAAYTTSDSDAQGFFTSPYGLALAQFDWGHPYELQTEWLVSQGVSFEALLKPWPIGATRVRFEGGYFVPSGYARTARAWSLSMSSAPVKYCAV